MRILLCGEMWFDLYVRRYKNIRMRKYLEKINIEQILIDIEQYKEVN